MDFYTITLAALVAAVVWVLWMTFAYARGYHDMGLPDAVRNLFDPLFWLDARRINRRRHVPRECSVFSAHRHIGPWVIWYYADTYAHKGYERERGL